MGLKKHAKHVEKKKIDGLFLGMAHTWTHAVGNAKSKKNLGVARHSCSLGGLYCARP